MFGGVIKQQTTTEDIMDIAMVTDMDRSNVPRCPAINGPMQFPMRRPPLIKDEDRPLFAAGIHLDINTLTQIDAADTVHP